MDRRIVGRRIVDRRIISVFMIASASLYMAVAAGAQQAAPANDGYQGVSRPPQSAIETSSEQAPVIAKPSAAVLASPAAPAQSAPTVNYVAPAAQDGYQPVTPQQEALSSRPASGFVDPDGDIVHPRASRPGELMEGVTIRVKLMNRLSSTESEKGEQFRGQVASDVLQDGKVLIPAGSGIEGQVSNVSAGHFGGHGSLRLKPEAVILPDGTKFQLHAETTGTPGSKTRIGGEGSINPGSRAKKDGIEYGAVVGTGVVAGAVVGGPVGALTGGLIGAGVVTTHLMVNHPQATLEPGSILLFTLTEPMNLMPASN
jgi:hypothetical protein